MAIIPLSWVHAGRGCCKFPNAAIRSVLEQPAIVIALQNVAILRQPAADDDEPDGGNNRVVIGPGDNRRAPITACQ